MEEYYEVCMEFNSDSEKVGERSKLISEIKKIKNDVNIKTGLENASRYLYLIQYNINTKPRLLETVTEFLKLVPRGIQINKINVNKYQEKPKINN